MSWHCKCGDINKDYEARCISCGLEMSEQDFVNLNINDNTLQLYKTASIPNIPNKIEPGSGIDEEYKDRLKKLTYGVLLAILLIGIIITELTGVIITEKDLWENLNYLWEYLGYLIIVFGVLGFIFRDKFINMVLKILKWHPLI